MPWACANLGSLPVQHQLCSLLLRLLLRPFRLWALHALQEGAGVSAGLDSFAALNVMEHMSNLAGLGHTVIASIHQPRSAIWEMFDKVFRTTLRSSTALAELLPAAEFLRS